MMKHQPRIAHDNNGNPLGLTANNVDSIPYASEYGFREGDIISSVNGIPIQSESQIFSLIPQFQNVKNFQVEVLRNGQRIRIPITIK
ncbi:MAG: PDZ domain-containing protein [Candidatus Hydrogenedentes bacterium]|nr:PDZ domain-containing protein [Candidatus Hydrogenedentota bacterium]